MSENRRRFSASPRPYPPTGRSGNRIEGELFFASATDFADAVDFTEKLPRVRIDVSRAPVRDLKGINALDITVLKFRREGLTIELVGMNVADATIMDKLGVHDQPGALERMLGHKCLGCSFRTYGKPHPNGVSPVCPQKHR